MQPFVEFRSDCAVCRALPAPLTYRLDVTVPRRTHSVATCSLSVPYNENTLILALATLPRDVNHVGVYPYRGGSRNYAAPSFFS